MTVSTPQTEPVHVGTVSQSQRVTRTEIPGTVKSESVLVLVIIVTRFAAQTILGSSGGRMHLN